MKTLLFTASTVVGALFFAASAVAADPGFLAPASDTQDGASPVVQSQPAFAISIAGIVRVDAAWVDQDDKFVSQKGVTPNIVDCNNPCPAAKFPMSQSFHFNDERVDLAIIGTATADNGLTYGFIFDVDETRAEIYLSNHFGRLSMGNTATATDALDVSGKSVMAGRGSWIFGGSKNVNHLIGGFNQVSLNRPAGIGSFQGGGTIRYTTPNYGGLTVSVSFTNESDGTIDGEGVEGLMMDGNAMSIEDIWSFAGQYTSSYGNYTTTLYAGYEQGNRGLKDGVISSGQISGVNCCFGSAGATPTPQSGHHDIDILSLGAKVTGMGAGFAVGYGKITVDTPGPTRDPVNAVLLGFFPDQDAEWFDAALSYSSGPWAISVGASRIVKEDGGVLQGFNSGPPFVTIVGLPDQTRIDQVQTALSLSGSYQLAPGLSISGGITHWKIENSDTFTTLFSPRGTNVSCPAWQVGNECPGPNINNTATTFTIATAMSF